MPSIQIPGTHARLTYAEELAKTGPARAFLWHVRDGQQSRPTRIYLDDQAAWILYPHPNGDAEMRRAAAQLAAPTIQTALGTPGFFDEHAEFDVAVDTFHPQVSEHGQLLWNPASTPWLD